MDLLEFKTNHEKKKVLEIQNSATDHPVVSVSVQTYNHGEYIKECLESIINQKTSFPFEILLGEDHSADNTREVCIDYAEKYPDKIRLFLHHRENNIPIDNQPTGRFNFIYNVLSARGKYIAFCDGDDYWTDPYKLQKQVDFLEANPAYNLVFHRTGINRNGSIYNPTPPKSKTVFDLVDYIQVLPIPIRTCSVVCRRNRNEMLIPPELLTNTAPAGDWSFYINSIGEGKIKYFTETMSIYRTHEQGIWSSLPNILKEQREIKYRKHLAEKIFTNNPKIQEALFNSIEILKFHITEHALKARDVQGIRDHAFKYKTRKVWKHLVPHKLRRFLKVFIWYVLYKIR